MRFAPEKYELLHLTQTPRRFNMRAEVNLGRIACVPAASIRILGIQVDCRLRWNEHIKKTAEKAEGKLRLLETLARSTWGARLERARLLHQAIIRPTMLYGAAVWAPPISLGQPYPNSMRRAIAPIEAIDRRALVRVTGAYKACPIKELHEEAAVTPLAVEIATARASHARRVRDGGLTGVFEMMKTKVATAARRLQSRTPRKVGPKNATTAERRASDEQAIRTAHAREEHGTNYHTRWLRKQIWLHLRSVAHESIGGYTSVTAVRKRHASFTRAESTLAVQLRTGRTGLREYLYKRHVHDITTPTCACGRANETIEHVVLFCVKYAQERRALLARLPHLQLDALLRSPVTLTILTRWIISIGRLEQFSAAKTRAVGDEHAESTRT